MNTFWLKVAGAIVGIVVIVVIVGMFTSNNAPPPEEPDKTFYDQTREDKEEFLAKPQAVESPQQQVPEQNQTIEEKVPAEETVAKTEHPQPAPKPAAPPKPRTLYFKPLSEIDQIEAERLLNVAVPGRSIGRLPMTGYNLMVPNCRDIIKKWPDSYYAYQAKRLLADLPERFWPRYKVTEEERDVSMFYEQRPGTQPFTMEESR